MIRVKVGQEDRSFTPGGYPKPLQIARTVCARIDDEKLVPATMPTQGPEARGAGMGPPAPHSTTCRPSSMPLPDSPPFAEAGPPPPAVPQCGRVVSSLIPVELVRSSE